MEDTAIAELERQISALVEQYDSLQRDYLQLKKVANTLTQERDNLQQKNALASKKIEAMIVRLREMENQNE